MHGKYLALMVVHRVNMLEYERVYTAPIITERQRPIVVLHTGPLPNHTNHGLQFLV